jgi:tRNA threonylcarbamoyl adenosine modification protein (Sua5/YciO/YrdC/YwlC family)
MQVLKQPSVRKLEKFIRSNDLDGKTFLHFTGGMYGIGCKAFSRDAIDRVRKLKGRPDNKGLIILVPDIEWFEQQSEHIPDRLHPLLEQYWPGNLTAVFKYSDPRFELLSFEGKVAFRVPDDPFLRTLIDIIGEPVISTSINISNLPPENDIKRLTGMYANWFDYAFLPSKSIVEYDAQPSTIVEFVSSRESKNQSGFDEIRCLREGSIPFYGVKKSFELPTILFVCTANICRSPMAEKLFNHYALAAGLDYAGDSCGLYPGGQPISAGSLQLLLEKGILEARDHISKQFTPDMINHSRLVLTMEERQRDFLRKNEPGQAAKILTLNEYLGEPGDVSDPFGSGIDTYRKTYEIIDNRIKRLVDKLKPSNKQQMDL